MNKELFALQLERARLLEQIVQQRATLIDQLTALKSASATAGRVLGTGQAIFNRLRRYPLMVVVGLCLAWALRPQSAWRLITRGLLILRVWRTLRAFLPEAALLPLYQFVRQRFAGR